MNIDPAALGAGVSLLISGGMSLDEAVQATKDLLTATAPKEEKIVARPLHRCNHCTRATLLSEEGARFMGWRFYKGPSQTGKALDITLCPVHSGLMGDRELPPSWEVRCEVCDWSTMEEKEPGDAPILTAYEARLAASEHKCEPVFSFIDPGGIYMREGNAEFQQELKETTPKGGRKWTP